MSTETETMGKGLENILGDCLPLARRHFEDKFIEEHAGFLKGLAERCGEFTDQAYLELPKELVAEHKEFLLALAEHCGERTWKVYETLPPHLHPNEYQLIERVMKEQGITHWDRYFSNHFPLWQHVFESMTTASPKKPLAVIVHNKNDHNGAFCRPYAVFYKPHYLDELLHLADYYALYVCEADNRTEAFRHIHRAVSLSKKRRKISLLVLGGHGNPYSLNLGKTEGTEHENNDNKKEISRKFEREPERYLSVLDGARFADVGKYIHKSGKIVLVSCSTGAERAKKNLSQVISEAIPHATVYAPKVNTVMKRFVFDKKGRVSDVVYQCGPEQTVKLCGGSHVSTE
ncbi:MAG: hypothetical protein Q8R53_01955 [Nanoarchaeota archaeon]|nr:hypothetical protein [Nanoarchaeota archaeon]